MVFKTLEGQPDKTSAFYSFLDLLCIHVCLCGGKGMCLWRPEECVVGSAEAGVTGGLDPHDKGAGSL